MLVLAQDTVAPLSKSIAFLGTPVRRLLVSAHSPEWLNLVCTNFPVFDVSFGMFSVKTVFCPIAEELSIASSLLVLSLLLSSDGSTFFDEPVSLSVGLTFDCH